MWLALEQWACYTMLRWQGRWLMDWVSQREMRNWLWA